MIDDRHQLPHDAAGHALHGRDEEVAVMHAMLSATRDGEAGIVLLEGTAGLGKTRMLSEIATMSDAAGLDYRTGAGDPDSALLPLGALLEALTAGEAPLLSRDMVRAAAGSLNERYWLLEEIQDALERAALQRPLVIAIDDLHFCDPATQLALRILPLRLATHAILWILAYRPQPGGGAADLTVGRLQQAGALGLRLAPLDGEAALALATVMLRGAPDARLSELILKVGGRPFELVELLRGLVDDGSIVWRDGAPALGLDAVPRIYRDAIHFRLSGLSPPARDLLRVLAVLGRGATLEQLAAFDEHAPVELMRRVDEALGSDLVDREGDRLRFRHDLIREAVEATVPLAVGRAWRLRAVETLLRAGVEPIGVAELVFELAAPGDLRAVTVLRQAASRIGVSSPDDAARLSDRALELAGTGYDEQVALSIETIRLRWRAGRPREAAALAAELLHGQLEPDAEALLRLEFAALSTQYSFAESVRQCRLGLACRPSSASVTARLSALLSLTLLNSGEVAQAAEVIPDALEHARRAGDVAAEVLALACCSTISWYQDALDEALALSRQAVQIANDHGPGARELWTPEIWHVMVLSSLGLDRPAIAMADVGVRQARSNGQAELVRYWMTTRARLLLDAGELEDAQSEAEATMAMVDDLGPGNWTEATAGYALSRIALHRGPPAGEPAWPGADRLHHDDEPLLRRSALWLAALGADARGDYDEVGRMLAEASRALRHLQPVLATPHDPADGVTFVRITLRAGEPAQAAAFAAWMQDRAARNPGFPLLAAVAEHATGLLGRDPAQLARAIELYGDGRRLSLASAYEDLGVLHLASGEKAAAVDCLRTALRVYREAGAVRSESRVRARLRREGIRPSRSRQPTASTWSNLTASQTQVVLLVARGATNREVASQLFLSPHTINSHLRNAFAKLGIRSRVELARLVAQAAATGELDMIE